MGAEDYRHIGVKDKKISVSDKHELNGSNSKQKKYQISLKPADVAILHPSFLCPVLNKKDDEFSIIVLTDEKFFNTYEKAEGKEDKKAGPALSGAVNRYLKLTKWSEIDKTSPASEPLFISPDEAKENIEVHYLWKLHELEDLTLKNKKEETFAQIDRRVINMYKKNKLVRGFEIVIKNIKKDLGLYDISWMNYVKPKTEDEEGYFFEIQDEYFNDYNEGYRSAYPDLQCDVSNDEAPSFTEEATEIQSYHPLFISDKESLDIGHLSDVHVSSRQHVFTQSKARLIDGKEGDKNRSDEIGGMVNTSYATLKNLMQQMSKEVDLLIFTGDLIDYNRNFNPDNETNGIHQLENSSDIWAALNLDNLTEKDQYPVGIDNLVMYELFRDYYKTHNKPIMLISGNHEGYTLPYGVSPRVKLARAANSSYNPFFSNKSEDQMIKKSIKQAKDDKEESEKAGPNIYDNRANEGIPADHNLTIPEAILMYGADYARIVMSGSFDIGGEKNFKSKNMEWFYKIFTPLSSYINVYNKQCFIALGWGGDESFIDAIPLEQGSWTKGGGYLPRSPEGVSDEQLAILEQAFELDKDTNILCSHFTYVNYDTKQPISKEGNINYNDTWRDYSKYDYGTFQLNRYSVYEKINGVNKEKKIDYTLSGHSHRSGLYQVINGDVDTFRSNMTVKGMVAKEDGNFDLENMGDKCRILVAGCGGPIAVQNHENEFYNWGLDTPSGNIIKFNGSKEKQVGILRAKNGKAKPRLAVALDYADIFLQEAEGEDKKIGKGKGLFSSMDSSKNKSPLTIKINELSNLLDIDFIEKISMVFYSKEGKVINIEGLYEKNITTGDMVFKPSNKDFYLDFGDSADYQFMGFITIKLKESSAPTVKHYDTEKKWVYPAQMFAQKKLALDSLSEIVQSMTEQGIEDYIISAYEAKEKARIKKDIRGYSVQRHKKYGEVPFFDWYEKNFEHEYA